MNRQQARNKARQANKTITMTYAELEEKLKNTADKVYQMYKNEIGYTATSIATDMCCATFLSTLHTDYKFGKKRLESVMEQVTGQIMAIGDETIKLDEAKEIVRKAGVNYMSYFGTSK